TQNVKTGTTRPPPLAGGGGVKLRRGSRGRETLLVVFLVGRAGRSGSPLGQRLGPGAGTALPALADAGPLPDLATQVVEPSLTNLAVTQHLDAVDARRVNQE